MPILWNETEKLFHLKTKHSSYIFCIAHGKYPVHLYYGKRLENTQGLAAFLNKLGGRPSVYAKSPEFIGKEDDFRLELVPQEYPFYGNTDLKIPAFSARYENGSRITNAVYAGHKIMDGKPRLCGLPSTYTESDAEAQTLELTLTDELTGLNIILSYTAYEETDAICRSVRVENNGEQTVDITSVMSASVDFLSADFDLVTLGGTWTDECNITRRPLAFGIQSVDSKRGSSGHMHSPFLALAEKGARENSGEVFGFSLVYSGNFVAGTEVNEFHISRAFIGMNPFDFNWRLNPGETFTAPEAVMVYSGKGFGGMSRTYHRLYRTRLARGTFRDKNRPVLANNWEATTFQFNEDKIIAIAQKAKEAGVELMVLDDGWFGNRNDDTTSLGDWYPNQEKLPNGIGGLAEKIEGLGLKFGLWFEPEMISPKSKLYEMHPDWCIHAEGRERNLGRQQLILDLTRQDVRDFIIGFLTDILKNNPISYIKWDYNRNFTDIGSAMLPPERQSEVAHRYILGLYEILETITTAFPNVLFEGCASGGGRFDPGQMYYFDQYWTSDNSDAIARLKIQYGTSLVMPAIMQGAHVSAYPHHSLHRFVPMKTRGHVAMTGQFGYEFDLSKATDETIAEMKEQIALSKKIESVVHFGDMYRLDSPFETNCSSVEFLSEDKNTAVLFHCCTLGKINGAPHFVKMSGLDRASEYACEETGEVFSGAVLEDVGLAFRHSKDFESWIYIFHKQK